MHGYIKTFWGLDLKMDISVVHLSQTSWTGRVWLADKSWFSIFTDGETRAFETCAECILQRGSWHMSGRLPSLMLDDDQLFHPDIAHTD